MTSVQQQPAMKLDVANVPSELKSLDRWVGWELAERDGRPTKIPKNPRGGQNASVTNRAHWTGFDEALTAAENRGWAGVGFVLVEDDDLVVIDLDDACDPEAAPPVESEAQRRVDQFATYTEVSQSGHGLHIFLRARKNTERCRRGKVELYDAARFIAMTGWRLPGTPATIEDRQDALDRLTTELWPEDAASATPEAAPTEDPVDTPDVAQTKRSDGFRGTDEELISTMMGQSNSGRIVKLWAGDHGGYGSASEADLALMSDIAFYDQNIDRIIRIFRESGLGQREKAGREDYLRRTAQKAVDGLRNKYRQGDQGADEKVPTLEQIARRLGVGPIERIVRLVSDDDDHAEYVLVMQGGSKVKLGTNLLSGTAVRRAAFESPGTPVIKGHRKGDWPKVARAIKMRSTTEEVFSTGNLIVGLIHEQIEHHASDRDRDKHNPAQGVEMVKAFGVGYWEGRVVANAAWISAELTRHRGFAISAKKVAGILRNRGWEAKQIAYREKVGENRTEFIGPGHPGRTTIARQNGTRKADVWVAPPQEGL